VEEIATGRKHDICVETSAVAGKASVRGTADKFPHAERRWRLAAQ